MLFGTAITATVVRAIDGDTVRLTSGGREESVRLLALDTEESNLGSNKPVTPWGHKAKEAAQQMFPIGATVTLEFPGSEPVEECWEKHRDNYGRLLGYLHKDGLDVQEHMIHEGYSPYFMKYGYADFPAYHDRYTAAERKSQTAHRGMWDQFTVNGYEARNYAVLGVWWQLRADAIDDYRSAKLSNPDLLDSRRDYRQLLELAKSETEATVFTELREYRMAGRHIVVTIGSFQQPFQVFIPNGVETGQDILRLLDNRYIAAGETHPRRGYAFVRGPLKLYQGKPEMIVTSPTQIADSPMT
ncbi:thermonuclease family protein [Nitrospira sp. Nam80]